MAWVTGEVKGFNFRNSNAGAYNNLEATPPETYVLFSDSYSQNRNDVVFGVSAFGANLSVNDADNLVAAKFAGYWYEIPGESSTFQVDLPATGLYRFRCAIGNTANSSFAPYRSIIKVKDGSTTLLTVDTGVGTGPSQDHYYDATGVDRTEAAWPGSNAAVDLTFSGTTCNVFLGDAAADYSVLAHFSLERLLVSTVKVGSLLAMFQ